MADKLVYNVALMDEIAQKYADGAAKMEVIIGKLNSTQSCFAAGYKGAAIDTIGGDGLITKLIQHYTLLRDCCSSTAAYVTHTKEEMVKRDANVVE